MPTIEEGRDAAISGNLQQARLIFEAILQENPRFEDAWLGLADVLTESNDKRICYENALKINKNSQAAREGLRSLVPEEDPLVAALKQTSTTMPMEEEEDAEFHSEMEETMISERISSSAPAMETKSETPTAVLIAVGLGLSVVVFAIVAGVLFFVLTSLVAP